jgi:methyl-accepting chemotaxis protein
MQSKFAGTIMLLAFLVTVITVCNIYVLGTFFFSTQTTVVEATGITTIMQTFLAEFWPRLLMLVFVNVIIIFIVSVMYSHQTAGPAYKLEQSIQRIADGDLTFEVQLRKNDNLKELAIALNNLLKKFRETLAKSKSLSDDIAVKLDSINDSERFGELAKRAAELQVLIEQFKISSDRVEKVIEGDEEEDEDEV